MKGLVLSGGKGTRLRPFTYSGAKQLVPIANIPVLHFPVRQLVEAGITEIGIVVGDTAAQIQEAMGDGTDFGAHFTYIPQPEPAGLAHAVAISEPFLGHAPFVMYLGDNVLLGGIRWFVDHFRNSAEPGVVLKSVPDPRAFGVAEIADGLLRRMVEKPAIPPSDLAVIGIYAFTPDVFPIIALQRPSTRGELEIADTINGLVAAGLPVHATVSEAYWIDTGKMEDILSANRAVLETFESQIHPAVGLNNCGMEGVVSVAEGAELRNCRLLGPVVIGKGARIENSIVGPYVAIGDGVTVRDSRIENSIVMEHAAIESCPLVLDSMIGRFAQARGVTGGSRVTLGDHSRVESPL